MRMPEYILILILSATISFAIFAIYFIKEITKPKYLKKRINISTRRSAEFINKKAISLLAITIYLLTLYVLLRVNYINQSDINFDILIRISSVLLTILIGYLFAKLFQVRAKKIEDHKIIAEYAFKLTAYRRFIYYILSTDKFWINKSDISTARYRYPKVTYWVLDDNKHIDYTKLQEFYNDKSFKSFRVRLYFLFDELVKQNYIGWIYDANAEIVYSKKRLEHYDTPINQIWYFFDNKNLDNSENIVNDLQLQYSYYAKDMIDQIKLIDPKYSGTKIITNKLIGQISGYVHYDILSKMIEMTKYNYEYITSNMKLVTNLMLVILITGILIPLLAQFTKDQIGLNNLIGFICLGGIGSVIIWIIFELKKLILDELNTA